MVKNLLANARDVGSIPGLGRFPGGGNGNPLQYSCLGNPLDRGAWRAAVHGVEKRQTWLMTKEQAATVGYMKPCTLPSPISVPSLSLIGK